MLLTDKEIGKITCGMVVEDIDDLYMQLIKAQLKKVQDRSNHWYKEMCPHTNRGSFKYGCVECWQSLLKEVE